MLFSFKDFVDLNAGVLVELMRIHPCLPPLFALLPFILFAPGLLGLLKSKAIKWKIASLACMIISGAVIVTTNQASSYEAVREAHIQQKAAILTRNGFLDDETQRPLETTPESLKKDAIVRTP